MDGGTGAAAELLSPAEAEWPPELRLPPPPPLPARAGPAPPLKPKEEPFPTAPHHLLPPPLQPKKEPSPPRHAEGFDDHHFLGSIMGAAAQSHPQQPPAPAAPVKRKRGRPPKNRDAAAAAPAPAPAPAKTPAKKKESEIVCFICFDGGNLVVCDRRGCPKVYHPACVKRDESFFRARGKWDCGWHICSICEKAAQYMCYTCTYSLCKGCITKGSFFGVRGNKGFCDTCYGTILLIESKDQDGSKMRVDFDDKNSWEYLFKLYWLDVKGKHFLSSEELINAKSRWTVPTTAGRREKEDSSDESYDANNDKDASFDVSSRKRRQNNSSGKRGRKRQKGLGVTARKHEISTKGSESLPNRLTTEATVMQNDTKWASSEMLEFIGHMRNGDSSYISQYDVQVLLLEYITQNNLRDPHKKSQIICDARLSNLFRKPRVAHFEMLKLLEMHFVKDNPTVNADSHPDSAQVGSDKRRKIHKKIERELTANPEDYAAIDMHNINLIYLRRSLMEDLIDDNATFSEKIAGAFVRIRICDIGQKQDMYRLVKVLGTHKVAERYSVGKKTTDYALAILNLDKKDVIPMDTISNQDFTEEECKRLRRSMKFGLVDRLKVGDIYEKAKIFRSLQFNDWLENEKQRLSHLRDRASETGQKLQLLNTPEERARRINEIPEVHVDPCMAPDYESAEEQYYKAADRTINSRSDLLFPERKGTKSNSVENHTQKSVNASGHMSNLPIENMTYRSGAFNNLNNTTVETSSLPSSGATLSDTEPEKVWHYKDPSGNVQGPFTLLQLSKWVIHFPSDLRIWLKFESEKNSLLLTEVLRKQQKDFVLTSAVTPGDNSVGTGTVQDRTNSCLVSNNPSSPIGYSVAYSSGLSCQLDEFSDRTKEGSKVLLGTLPSRSLKDAHSLHGQVQHPANYSCTIPSSTPPSSHNVGVPREQVGEWNNRQTIGRMWSPTVPSMNHSLKSDVELYPGGYAVKDQLQNDSKSILPARSVESFVSRMDSGSLKVSVLTPQQTDRDHASCLHTKSPSEVNTVNKDKDSCWCSATNDGTHDNLQLSIAYPKPESCSPTNPVEGRDSSSVGVLNQSGAPACRPQQVPSMSTTSSSKTEATINQHNTSLTDASSKPFDQHSELNHDPVFSSNTQDCEYEYPSPTPKLEVKEISMNQLGSTSVTPKDSGAKICAHSSISSVLESSGPPAGNICSLQSLKQTSCLEERHLRDRDTTAQKEQVNEENTAVKRKNIVANPISDDEGIAVSDVLESLTEQNCEKFNVLGAEPSENFVPASTVEEQPQCSSPIALSPWGEQNYYQGDTVDSALWGVQVDHSNDIWSMPSPTPALQSSSGLGADGKNTSHVIEKVMEARESTYVETLLKQREKKMKLGNSGASTGSGALEQVRAKQSVASGPSLDASTKTADWQSSGTSLEGSAKASGWKPPGLLLEGITKASVCQPSGPSPEGGLEGQQPSDISKVSKASCWQSSDSTLGKGTKASGWGEWKTEWGTKVSDWQRSSSFPDGSTKGSCWQPPGSTEGSAKASGRQQSSAEKSEKVDGWQRTSSPEGSRKASGWYSSGRESFRANSTLGANEKHKSSSHRSTTPTAKNSWEASKSHGNDDKNTAGLGEALGKNRSWHPSSGDANRGSQGAHNHDRYSHGRDSRRFSSNHSRRIMIIVGIVAVANHLIIVRIMIIVGIVANHLIVVRIMIIVGIVAVADHLIIVRITAMADHQDPCQEDSRQEDSRQEGYANTMRVDTALRATSARIYIVRSPCC
ncbi:hypothetical protein EJB05_23755, partial [Eragrostis curvula]